MQFTQIGLIGYGEVGKTFALGLKEKPGVTSVSAWDLKFAAPTPLSLQAADQAAQGVFQHLPKDASWQDYADCLLAARQQGV